MTRPAIVKASMKKKPPRGITKDGRKKKKAGRPESQKVKERRAQALELRMSGITYAKIAETLGGYTDASHVKRDIERGLANVQMDAAKNVVAMDIAMMDEFKMRCLHALRNNGDLSQIDRILRVTDYKYRLLGITDETVRALQSEHGLTVNIGGKKSQVMVVQAAPETEEEFLNKMMRAVGVDPKSKEGKRWRQQNINYGDRELPLLQGGANSDRDAIEGAARITDEEIVDAEIVEEDE